MHFNRTKYDKTRLFSRPSHGTYKINVICIYLTAEIKQKFMQTSINQIGELNMCFNEKNLA